MPQAGVQQGWPPLHGLPLVSFGPPLLKKGGGGFEPTALCQRGPWPLFSVDSTQILHTNSDKTFWENLKKFCPNSRVEFV